MRPRRRDDPRARAASAVRGVRPANGVEKYLADHYDGQLFSELGRYLVGRGLIAPGRTVIDVGCGFGAFVQLARGAGAFAVGIDLGTIEVEIAADRLRRLGAHVLRADARRLPLISGSADLLTYLHVLEHVRDVEGVIAEGVRGLRPGGALYMLAPNYAATFWEPHYHVPWFPMLPRPLAVRYLRALGRDADFFARRVNYTTWHGVIGALRRQRLRIEFPRARKIADPATIRRVTLARAVSFARAAGLGSLLTSLVVGPLQGVVEVLAWKEG